MIKNKKINTLSIKFSALTLIMVSFLFLSVSCSGNNKDPDIISSDMAESVSRDVALPAVDFIADGIIFDGEYGSKESYKDFEINWKNDNQYFYGAIKSKSTGFVSIAVQPGNRMKDADMILGFVKDGKVSVFDLFSTGDFGPHLPDTELGGSDDIIQFGGSDDGTFTIIEFKRLLSTGDKYDKDIVEGKNRIIWASSNEDNQESKHSNRGYGEIEIKLP